MVLDSVVSLWMSSLLSADDVVMLASLNDDLKLVVGRFAAKSEAAGMGISTSKSWVAALSVGVKEF